MTTLYRSVLIESAEQAEALPVGTVIECTGGILVGVAPHRKVAPGEWFGGNGRVPTEDLRIGASEAIRSEWTALVPIEAEEERRSMYTDPDTGEARHDFFPDRRTDGSPVHTHTRLVTPWEAAE